MARILYQALQSRGALQKGGAQVDVYSILLYRAQKTEVRTISYVPESCDCFLRPYCGCLLPAQAANTAGFSELFRIV